VYKFGTPASSQRLNGVQVCKPQEDKQEETHTSSSLIGIIVNKTQVLANKSKAHVSHNVLLERALSKAVHG